MLLLFITDTLKFYRQQFFFLMAILLPVAIPMELIQAFLSINLEQDFQNTLPLMVAVNLIMYPIYQTALVVGIDKTLNGHASNPKGLILQGLPFWFSILLINILFYSAVGIGIMTFVIPGIFFAVRLSLAEQNNILDNESVFNALKSSFTETKDAFWYILLGMLILITGSFLVSWPVSYLLNSALPNSPVSYFISSIVSDAFYPLLVIYLLRIRHFLKHNE